VCHLVAQATLIPEAQRDRGRNGIASYVTEACGRESRKSSEKKASTTRWNEANRDSAKTALSPDRTIPIWKVGAGATASQS
jgi:hypothetical protein